MTAPQQIGRLALRQEGEWWVGYFARPMIMDGAAELGRIRFAIARDPQNKRMFISLMSKVVADMIEHQTGVRPGMVEQSAPEHERAGNA
jgi:hypothetical protein